MRCWQDHYWARPEVDCPRVDASTRKATLLFTPSYGTGERYGAITYMVEVSSCSDQVLPGSIHYYTTASWPSCCTPVIWSYVELYVSGYPFAYWTKM